jgi:hypothetical protein
MEMGMGMKKGLLLSDNKYEEKRFSLCPQVQTPTFVLKICSFDARIQGQPEDGRSRALWIQGQKPEFKNTLHLFYGVVEAQS